MRQTFAVVAAVSALLLEACPASDTAEPAGTCSTSITVTDITRTEQRCLLQRLARKSDGKVRCDVVWELPPNGMLTQCARPFLAPVGNGQAPKNSAGGVNCNVA
jgi:hypothetical protein